MQNVVPVTVDGKVNDLTIKFLLRLGNTWVSIEQAHAQGVRVLQIIESARMGWFALIEQTAAAAPSSPSE